MTNKIKELPPFPFKFTVFRGGNNIVYTATQHQSYKQDIQVDWEEDKYGDGTWHRKDSALQLLQKGDWQLVETPNEDLLNKIKQFSQAGHEVIVTNGEYRVFPEGECFAYKCDNDEVLVKTMEALSYLDSLEVE